MSTINAYEPLAPTEPAGSKQMQDGPLLAESVAKDFRTRWDTIQAGFVDEPREAVKRADELVGQSIEQLSTSFSEARNKLEGQWDRGDDVSTEDLRLALQKY